jgi:hypothetical protein
MEDLDIISLNKSVSNTTHKGVKLEAYIMTRIDNPYVQYNPSKGNVVANALSCKFVPPIIDCLIIDFKLVDISSL